MSRWRVAIRSVGKSTARKAYNEDRARVVARTKRGRLLAAVADGATTTFRSGQWSTALVDAWVTGQLRFNHSNGRLAESVEPLAKDWRRANPPPTDAWFHRAAAAEGSYSAFLGVEAWWLGRSWRWRALAVGDCNLFVLDGLGTVETSFPATDAGELRRNPVLVATKREANAAWLRRRLRRAGTVPKRGTLVLATDAVAGWALDALERADDPWPTLRTAVASDRAFAAWVDFERSASRLVDDDSTLIWIERR